MQSDPVIQSPLEGLPKTGKYLVRIVNVMGYLHNFPDYAGPRARIEMAIQGGGDAGKILVDNVSLPHPKESSGMIQRRMRIACRLGLVAWGTQGTVQIDWKSLQGRFCQVDVAYKNLGGGEFLTVGNYELIEGAHTQPEPRINLAAVDGEHVIDEHPPVNPTVKEYVLIDGTCFFHHCELASYQSAALFCGEASQEVIDLPRCPLGLWLKQADGWPVARIP